MSTPPTLTDPPAPPSRGDAPEAFVAKANAFIAWMAEIVPEMQVYIDWLRVNFVLIDDAGWPVLPGVRSPFGIGTKTPSAELDVRDTTGDGDVRIALWANGTVLGQIGRSAAQMFMDTVNGNPFLMFIGGVELYRALANEVLIGTAAASTTLASGSAVNTGIQLTKDGGIASQRNAAANLAIGKAAGYTDGNLAVFNVGGVGVGSISTNGSSVSFNTSSDYRLKANVVRLSGARARLRGLEAKQFNWVSNPGGELIDGFIAHEAQAIVPESVNGAKDGMREEEFEISPERATGTFDEDNVEIIEPAVMGTRVVPAYQGIDQSKLLPLLWAAVTELDAADQAKDAQINALLARIEALEAA